MKEQKTHTVSLTFNQMVSVESVLASVRVGDVPLVHIADAHSGMMRLRDSIADLRRKPWL